MRPPNAFLASIFVVLASCAGSPTPPATTSEVATPPTRPESAAPEGGAACGDRTCGVNELCVPQGFCSGIRPPMTPEEQAVRYSCVAISPRCATNPTCECAGETCQWGGCAGITRGVVQCVCA